MGRTQTTVRRVWLFYTLQLRLASLHLFEVGVGFLLEVILSAGDSVLRSIK
ncbi:hypothetical protein PIB30_065096 [Stylosanthes scabra]|uniref:Uncharacterized protein n=1 Tax=Stylosanthes scabra TaxID=79078 RepID=A0ABU6VLP3_9FABA|nr:hypothetical protein [Stylosanthes scabra]